MQTLDKEKKVIYKNGRKRLLIYNLLIVEESTLRRKFVVREMYLITCDMRIVASSTVTQKLYTGWPLLLRITKSPSVSKFHLTFMRLSNELANIDKRSNIVIMQIPKNYKYGTVVMTYHLDMLL